MIAVRKTTSLGLLLGSGLIAAACYADEPGPASPNDDRAWSTRASFETWLYGTRNDLRQDPLTNPGNRIARMPLQTWTLDGRLNLRAENGPVQLLLSPRLTEQRSDVQAASATDALTQTSSRQGSAKLSQGFVRYLAGDTALTLGRELFVWGPANFRSPSSPFYFDAGRSNPLAATPGIDLLRLTQGFGKFRVTAAHIDASRQIQPAQDWSHTQLLKADHQGSNHLLSLIVGRQHGHRAHAGNFVGAFAQLTPDDAWLLYGEIGSSRQAYRMLPAAPSATPNGPLFQFEQPAPRSVNALIGASYTLENGQTLIAEWLHTTGGYTATQTQAYFAQAQRASVLAQTQPAMGYASLGQALAAAPRLLGRDYLWLNWQSNPQEQGMLWRLGWTQNLTDRSAQAMAYVEKNLIPQLSGFVAITTNIGSRNSEFGMLWRSSVTAGIKWFAF